MAGFYSPKRNAFERIIITGLLCWAAYMSSPLMVESEIMPIAAVFYSLAALGCLGLLQSFLMMLARFLEWVSSHQASGKEGTSKWATFKDLKSELIPSQKAPFWGVLAKSCNKPLFIDFASNALCVAPAGSGKGIYTVIPNALAIYDSTVNGDFKGEQVTMLKEPLEERGERVLSLNPGGLWKDKIGEGDSYNPLDIIVDDLHRPGGLRDVPDDLRELTAQILPEPAQTESDNSYWREGSRRAIADAILIEAMIEEYDANLSSVALLIEDRDALQYNLRWIIGVGLAGKPLSDGAMPIEHTEWAQKHDPEDVASFAKLVRSRAVNLLALMCNIDSKTFDSFISGAQQALAPFAFGRLAPAMQRSTFRMEDLKDSEVPVNLFIVADASRMEAYKAYIGLIQWCAMTAIKRHPNKSRPVYFIMDEATNYKIHGLESLLTWGRSYGLRLLLIFQDLSAFERVYGKMALETLLSETECKIFLPGQRSPKTLEMIVKMLGNQSVMAANLSGQEKGLRESMSESTRPLMTADEIRRSRYGLLLVRQKPPALIEPISYAEIHPWREQVGINPFHGKPFLKKVRLKLRRRK
jgi:type IV secretion system protein VirD4